MIRRNSLTLRCNVTIVLVNIGDFKRFSVLLPASFLFKFSWVWRIPFLYLAGVILIRLGHGTLCISETTRIADYTLIILTMLLYGRAFTLQDK